MATPTSNGHRGTTTGTTTGAPAINRNSTVIAELSLTPAEVYETAGHLWKQVEAARVECKNLYYLLPGGTEAEFEIGECLTVLRKALARISKARGTLLARQEELPFDAPTRSGDDDDA